MILQDLTNKVNFEQSEGKKLNRIKLFHDKNSKQTLVNRIVTCSKDQRKKNQLASYRSLQVNRKSYYHSGRKLIKQERYKQKQNESQKDLFKDKSAKLNSIQSVSQTKGKIKSDFKSARTLSNRYGVKKTKKPIAMSSTKILSNKVKINTFEEAKSTIESQKITPILIPQTNNTLVKKRRRYLTQASTSLHSARIEQKYKINQQTNSPERKQSSINQISRINSEQPPSQQISILQNIIELQYLLGGIVASSQKKSKKLNKQNFEPLNNRKGKQGQQYESNQIFIPTARYHKLTANISTKRQQKLKQLKCSTLIMRSIDKIKNVFPKGFFHDKLSTLE